jgi:hypothetical protein
MDLSKFSIGYTSMRDIMPNTRLYKYDAFKDIDNSWNTSIHKYGAYIWGANNVEDMELYFHLVKNMCDNKKMIIRNPLYLEYNQPEIISSDVYFITRFSDKPLDHPGRELVYVIDLVANYYFEKENIVVGIFLGTGDVGLHITVAYIIYFNQCRTLLFNHLNNRLDIPAYHYYLPNIYNIIQNINIEKMRDEMPLIRTIEGYSPGLFHGLCSYVNGVYIMDSIGINNNIDELILGFNDPYLLEKYYKNKYKNINIVKGVTLTELVSPKIYKGVIFKYGHFHLTNKGLDFVKSYINKVMPINDTYQSEIEHINQNFYPIFSINIRCLTSQIKDQDIVISEVINKLKQVYPKSFFLIGGFLGDYNEEIIEKLQGCIAINVNGGYSHILNEYKNMFTAIKDRVSHEHIKSIIDLKVNNVLGFVKNSHFSINMNMGYSCVDSILCNVPSTYFGTKWNDHNRNLWYVSKERHKELIYIVPPDITFFTDNPYEPITCQINSGTIVDIAVNYITNN